MALCGVCGAEREPGTRFCRRCGTEFGPQVAGPQRPADTPWTTVEAPGPPVSGVPQLSGTGHGPGWYAVLAGAVAVLVVALVLGVMAFTGTGGDVDPAAGPATPSQIGPRTSPPPPPSTSTPPRTTRPAPTSSKPPSNPGNDLVAVSPVLAQHSLAPLVVEVATAYFLSINTRDFVTYRSLFTSEIQADLDLDQLAEGFRSTYDHDILLVDIEETADGRVAAWVDFTSNQDAADGPDGQTCTNWHIALFLQAEAGRAVIGAPPPEYRADYWAC